MIAASSLRSPQYPWYHRHVITIILHEYD